MILADPEGFCEILTDVLSAGMPPWTRTLIQCHSLTNRNSCCPQGCKPPPPPPTPGSDKLEDEGCSMYDNNSDRHGSYSTDFFTMVIFFYLYISCTQNVFTVIVVKLWLYSTFCKYTVLLNISIQYFFQSFHHRFFCLFHHVCNPLDEGCSIVHVIVVTKAVFKLEMSCRHDTLFSFSTDCSVFYPPPSQAVTGAMAAPRMSGRPSVRIFVYVANFGNPLGDFFILHTSLRILGFMTFHLLCELHLSANVADIWQTVSDG